MGWMLLIAFVAVAVLSARGARSDATGRGSRTLRRRLGIAVAAWAALMALGMAVFLVGARLDDQPELSGPEGAAVSYAATRDSAFAERAWQALHPNLRAATTYDDYVACYFAEGGEPAPTEAEPDLRVPSDDVVVQHDSTYTASDRRDDVGVVAVDVDIDGDGDPRTVEIFLSPIPGPGWFVTGSNPADPCLLGAERLGERLRSSAPITIELREIPELDGHRVLAGVWRNEPTDGDLVGGAFWTVYDEYAFDVVHPMREPGDASITGATEGAGGAPVPREGWGADAYLWHQVALMDPGRHTIELWADPGELRPDDGHVPASPIARTCTIEIDVVAGLPVWLVVTGVPADGPCEFSSQDVP